MLDIEKERSKIIRQLLVYAKKQLSAEQLKPMLGFLEQYYSYSSVQDLQARPIRDLYGAFLSHWELMRQRRKGEYKWRILNPQLSSDGWESSHTVLEFIFEDQPFLVDTLCKEINRQGYTIHFMVHLGGTRVIRSKSSEIEQVLPYDASPANALREAPIYIEIDRQTNEEVLATLHKGLERVIADARIVVADWQLMQKEVQQALDEMEQFQPPVDKAELMETKAFLHWLLDNHFTFMGYRNYDLIGQDESMALQLIPDSGLGVLRDTSQSKLTRYYSELPEAARQQGLSKQILLLAKTNTRSSVHGRRYTDFVSVKRFDAKGNIVGERWFIGLYTSPVYIDNPRTIPVVRLKVAEVLKRSDLPQSGHAYKALAHILETFPRDDLFHATVDELYDMGMGVLELQDRRCIRMFTRKDIYGRFISCLVYLPRDDFNVELCNRMQDILQEAFHGLEISYETLFSDSILAHIHFTIRIDPKQPRKYDLSKIEQRLIAASRSWRDGLHEQLVSHFGEEKGNALNLHYGRAFPSNYTEAFSPRTAVEDIARIETLNTIDDLAMRLYRPAHAAENTIRFKLFHRDETIPLSDAIPILEKMGLRVIGEQPYQIQLGKKHSAWINDFNMYYLAGVLTIEGNGEVFQEAFYNIWTKQAEHDGFNALVFGANLNWREITIVRAYAKYLKQIGFTFSQDYMEETLTRNPGVTRLLVQLFIACFDPIQNAEHDRNKPAIKTLEEQIKNALENVANLDEDRILRMFWNLIQATVRTNFFQQMADGQHKPYLSFKFNPSEVHQLPLPRPEHEIFVYSPRFEGIHLRAGKVARGGIRWSDRREDFRREVLGLMKAQQVKNAVIVPAGAKGGFVVKFMAADASREQVLQEGVRCYQDFIRGLLDITDNLKGHTIVAPIATVCYDSHDPYLVVAADKGTATFSDIANRIAKDYHFWLGDAFASGGSAGYDHKKIGITARGAWESVKRHFQELAKNIVTHPFTVLGIGDMSGDVFGNGMLQSRQIKLLAAFNGTHIFLDPNPDPELSYQERERLFHLPRSTWEDYDSNLISKGGGVFRRSLKSIRISPEVKRILGIKKEQLSPNDLIQAMLKMPVDLLWNGGIGTYVKASNETDQEVGDRANDAIRINGNDLSCRVVAEGGNLGFTQLGRIEYELRGGHINTDFIDNSGGVDCSDHEVNIKILLDAVVDRGELTEKSRNTLLAKMTDEVAELVLHNNYRQVRAISLAVDQSLIYIDLYERLIKDYAREGKLDPKLEFLPDDSVFISRKAAGRGLTRPEIAVLLAYSKIILKAEILKTELTNDAYLSRYIQYAFPAQLNRRYYAFMEHHRLRKEIIATQLSNFLITDMGITFVYQMQEETRASVQTIVRAYVICREIFNLSDYWESIDSLDVPVALQSEMTLEVVALIRRSVRWFLRNQRFGLDVKATTDLFLRGVKKLSSELPYLLKGAEKTYFEEKNEQWVTAGVTKNIAAQIASTRALYSTLNIIEAATEYSGDLLKVAEVYFALADRLSLDEFHELINHYPVETRWMILARSAVKGDLDWQQRAITLAVLKCKNRPKESYVCVDSWLEKHHDLVTRWQGLFTEMKASATFEYSMLVVLMRGLLDLSKAT